MKRRDFLQAGMTAAMVAATHRICSQQTCVAQNASSQTAVPLEDRICLFTDLIDDSGYSYKDVASILQQLKIPGADVTVRSGGLVPPERAAEELPKLAAVLQDHGLSIPMLSTGILTAEDATAPAILETMQQLGIRCYKLGYYHYPDLSQWEKELDATRAHLRELIKLGEGAKVVAGVHNHAGPTVGAAMWDLYALLENLDDQRVGSYFDPAHATIEGGEFGWKLGFQRLSKKIKMIAIKDFIWEKIEGRWRARWCPLGEGMVRWNEFFALLKTISFDGPISLHVEYDPGGATAAARLENSLAAAERDLKFLRAMLQQSA